MDKQKDFNFEVDVLPVISLLAVCISFLLITAVWVQLGSLDLSQSIGSEAKDEKAPTVWAEFYDNGNVELTLKDFDSKNADYSYAIVKSDREGVNLTQLEENIAQIKTRYPDLNTVVVLPKSNSKYEDVVGLIDRFRKHQFRDVGISPL
ncbi:MAG: biopolymer transporter ExbD [Bdellovibrionales bacterium]|nr:biopolymer transporter ExbD [Bdellovibrionales bacterium]